MRGRSADTHAIRFSSKDAASNGRNGAIERVAGSLAVTRALGDAYLKKPNFSFEPYKVRRIPQSTTD